MYYRPQGKAVAADVIPFYHNGEFKLFYLHDFRDWENHVEGVPWVLLTTKDLVNYEVHGEVIPRGTKEEQDLFIFTGSVFEHEGLFYIFYTGHNPYLRQQGLPEQKVLLATSKDLIHWEKQKDFVFAAPDWIEMHDFRDPFVYIDEETGMFKMLLAARMKDGPIERRGCTLRAESKDLKNWTLEKEPFYYESNYFTHECPDLFKMGDWYYLIFSEFSSNYLTRYRMSKSMNGPWITPPNDSFDVNSFYAAKTASDGNKRYLFGWNPIRHLEIDNENWQWGGTIVPHELVQDENGYLHVKAPDTILAQYQEEVPLEVKFTYKDVEVGENELILSGNRTGYSHALLNELPENCLIEAKFKFENPYSDFGLLFRSDDEGSNNYILRLEPYHNRFSFNLSFSRILFCKPKYLNDNERYAHLNVNDWHNIKVIIEGSVIEIYIDDKFALSSRMFDRKEGLLGFYSEKYGVTFKDIKIKK